MIINSTCYVSHCIVDNFLLYVLQHILLELSQMNEMCVSTVVDPQGIEKVMEQLKQKAAYICVAGRYNAGKSTLINALVGAEYASKFLHLTCMYHRCRLGKFLVLKYFVT